jgi:membrane-associated protease RseP (regulator of RpoE activity)
MVGTVSFLREGEMSSADVCKTQFIGIKAEGHDQGGTLKPLTKLTTPRGVVAADFVGTTATNIYSNGLAQRAGLAKGDQILSIDGRPMASTADLTQAFTVAVYEKRTMAVVFRRGKTEMTTTLSAGAAADGSYTEMQVDAAMRAPQTMTLDWSMVEEVKTSDYGASHWVSMMTPKDTKRPVWHYHYTVTQTRDRVFAAAQYLKEACDRSKELGF